MFKTEFSSNPNGKLFMDHFNDVRLYNPDKHFIGAEHEIWMRNYMLGIGEVAAIITFKFQNIRDLLAFTIYGKPANYMAAMLKKFYPDTEMDTVFAHMVFHYKKRNLNMQQPLMKDWWHGLCQEHKNETAIQQSLGI